jgi:hypothetical protein
MGPAASRMGVKVQWVGRRSGRSLSFRVVKRRIEGDETGQAGEGGGCLLQTRRGELVRATATGWAMGRMR